MPQARRLDELKILESSGVDRPANEADGWLVMKDATGALTMNSVSVSGSTPPGNGYTVTPTGGVYLGPNTIQTTGTGIIWGPPPTNPPPVAKGGQGPHAYKASADDPKICAVCGKSQGDGMHPRFTSKGEPAPTRKEGGMPPDPKKLEGLDPDVKAYLDDLQAKVDAAGTPPAGDGGTGTPPAGTGTPPAGTGTPPPAADLPPVDAIAAAKAVETLQKALEDEKTARAEATTKAADLADRVAKMEAKERTAEFVAKAKDLPNLGGPNELGGMLMVISEKVPEDTFKALDRILKAANAQLEKGALFVARGDGGADGADGEDDINAKVEKLAKARVEAGTSPTIEQAKLAVLKENRDLASAYRAQ